MQTLYRGNLHKIVRILERRLLALALTDISSAWLISKQRLLWRWYQRLVCQRHESLAMLAMR